MFYSTSFGISLESPIRLNNFRQISSRENCDVTIRFGALELPEGVHKDKYQIVYPMPSGILLYWFDIGGFYLEEGKRVTIHITTKSQRNNYIEAVLMGPVMGMLLYQQERYNIFHSSVVSKPDGRGALAFSAVMGGGKSSMAAAMLQSSYSLVSDDLLAVRYENSHTLVQSGFPGMKLWEDSSGALVEDGKNLPMIGDEGDFEKRFLELNHSYMEGEQPLHSLFLLEFGDVPEPQLIPLPKKEALFFLMPHWYGALFGGELMPVLGRDRHFKECSSLAGKTRIYRLIRPRSLERIDESVRLIDTFREENPLERT